MYVLDQFKISTQSEDDKVGIFEISPLPRGFGETLGNALRRILLSSIPGTAVTSIKIAGVQHEYSTLADVQDDILSIALNIKEMPLHSQSEEPVVLNLKTKGEKSASVEVTAADIEKNSQVEIVDSEHYITTLTGTADLDVQITVERGVGFEPHKDKARTEIGMIPIDANYNPVKNVALNVVNARVGQRTDLDKIILKIVTNGAVKPSVVLHQSAQLLLELSTHLLDSAEDVLSGKSQGLIGTKTEDDTEPAPVREPLPLESLGLSNRLSNALSRAGFTDLYDLNGMTEEELSNVKGMGAKSLSELLEVMDKFDIEHK